MLTKVAACEQADVDAAVKAARAAFDKGTWANMPPAKRKRIMLKLAELMMKNREELALLETLDMGKPIAYSTTRRHPGLGQHRAVVRRGHRQDLRRGGADAGQCRGHDHPRAVGVVAAVVPWNFPLLMACWKISPALAAGNSVILKPAEQSPLTAIRLAELAAEAGIPEGVFNVLPGFGETAGQALGRHMDVDVLAFTGSTEVGKYFLRYSGESNMKQVWLECGGKSPNIVLADAPNLDIAARRTAFGIWFNQGEVCTAGSRLIVEDKIKDAVPREGHGDRPEDDAGRSARPQDPDGRHGRRDPDQARHGLHRGRPEGRRQARAWAASRSISTTPAASSSPPCSTASTTR